jgi:hypothetical protein
MTWDVDRDYASITGYASSVSDLIKNALAGRVPPGGLPSTCPSGVGPAPTPAPVAGETSV